MKKKLLVISTVLLVGILTALVVYNYVFQGEHRNIASEKATVSLSADEFYSHFENNEALATTNYLDKVVETKGKITLIEGTDIELNNKVQISFNSKETLKLQKGQSLTIKGRCVGYDELLEVVKIDQATIINK